MLISLKKVTYQVPDVEKAGDWYSRILNKKAEVSTPFYIQFHIGDTRLDLIPATYSSADNADRVVAYWDVDDIETSYHQLLEQGAKPLSRIETVSDHQVAKVIDPFGNIIGLTCREKRHSKKSAEKQPSETALTLAFCRALAAIDERMERRGSDYLAEIFLTDYGKRTLLDHAAREMVMKKLLPDEFYRYFIARTAYMDQKFEHALQNNIPQIVLLGAGYDSRPYRFIRQIQDSEIFELDSPATQERKIEILTKANIPVPEGLTYVPINFKKQRMDEVLLQAGFSKGKKTLFMCEGFIYYLKAETIGKILNFIKYNSPPGSIICMDHLTQSIPSTHSADPFLFWLESKEMVSFLTSAGFTVTELLTHVDMEQWYLTFKDSASAGTIFDHYLFIEATIQK